MSTKDGDIRILIEEIKGDIKLIMGKVEDIISSVKDLASNSVTREELKLTLDPVHERLISLEVFRGNVIKALIGIGGAVVFGLFAYLVARNIPGLNL